MGVANILSRLGRGLARYGTAPVNPVTPPFLPSGEYDPEYGATGLNRPAPVNRFDESVSEPEPFVTTREKPVPDAKPPSASSLGPPPVKRLDARDEAMDLGPAPVPEKTSWKRQLAAGLLRMTPVVNLTDIPDEVAAPGFAQKYRQYKSKADDVERRAALEDRQEGRDLTRLQRDISMRGVRRQEDEDKRRDERMRSDDIAAANKQIQDEGGSLFESDPSAIVGKEETHEIRTDAHGRKYIAPKPTEWQRQKKAAEQVNWNTMGDLIDMFPGEFPELQGKKGFRSPEEASRSSEMRQKRISPQFEARIMGLMQARQTQQANAELRRELASESNKTRMLVAGLSKGGGAGSSGDSGAAETIATDPLSGSILAQTGLSMPAFLALTGRATQLSRDKETRSRAYKEAEQFANRKGVDVSTLSSQYIAYNDVLKRNIARLNNTKIMEAELDATLDNLESVVNKQDLSRLRFANVAKIWAGQEVNDPLAQQYAFHFGQLRNELSAYYAATQGRSGGDLTISDKREADETIRRGISTGSLTGLRAGVKESTAKMTPVMQRSVVTANKAIWGLFGVGGNYREPGAAQGAPSQQSGGASIPRINTKEEHDKIPSGAKYIDAADGKTYTKR